MKIETIKSLIISAIWCLPLVTGIVEVIKKAWPTLSTRFVPLISVMVGITTGLILIEATIVGGVVGLIIGLGAVGLWEFGKTTVAGK
jgi:hypothetical protein